jgi:hypothetical protein
MSRISGDIILFFFAAAASSGFPAFHLPLPPNENRSHRLNTTLRAMVEMAEDQPAWATNDKAEVRKSS